MLSRYYEKCLTWQSKVTWFPCSHVSSESLPFLLSSVFTQKKIMHPCAPSHLGLQFHILASVRTAVSNVTLLNALQIPCSFYNNPSYYYHHHPHFTDRFIKTSGFHNVTQMGWIDGSGGKEFTLSSIPRTHRA